MLRRFFATLFCLGWIWPAQAADGQDLQQLHAAAQRFVDAEMAKARLDARAVALPDARLFLPACDSLQTAWPQGRPAEQVQVSCPALGWSLALPVKVRGTATVYVASALIGAGQTLGMGDIRLAQVDNPALARQGVADAAQIVGRAARTQIPPGSVIRVSSLRAPFVVRMRQPVRALVEIGGGQVTADGVANNNAAAGETVGVRMPSGRVVQGVARHDGSVAVSLP